MSNIIGIDVSKASLDCAWLRDSDQEKAKRRNCKNDVRCFESLITWAEAFSGVPRQSLAFVIEPTNIYHEQLVQFLHRKQSIGVKSCLLHGGSNEYWCPPPLRGMDRQIGLN